MEGFFGSFMSITEIYTVPPKTEKRGDDVSIDTFTMRSHLRFFDKIC